MTHFSFKLLKRRAPFLLFILSLVFFILAKTLPSRDADAVIEKMTEAAQTMSQATSILKECRKDEDLAIDPSTDPNRTGLVGVRFSSITTSLGNLEAKRTTTNANFAGLVVYLLKEAGVKEGDAIAVGASGSFPALVVAVLSASKAMDLNPLIIVSLGASQWGANLPDFHLLHMYDCLWDHGVFAFTLAGVSMGGERDRGEDMEEEGRRLLIKAMEESGIPVVDESGLVPTVEVKMRLYAEAARGQPIKAFVNIGGSWSNLGTDPEVLNLKPGLIRFHHIPPVEKRGVLYAMGERGVPVIHLLFIRGLVERYGLAWDPVPLPEAGAGKIYKRVRERQPSFLYISFSFFILLLVLLGIVTKGSL